MGAKQLDATAHDGLLIVSSELAGQLQKAGLTGFQFLPVRGRSRRAPHDSFCHLAISTVWPRLHPSSQFVTEDLCPACGRGGHFDVHPTGTKLIYEALPPVPTDFGVTWEYFGTWTLVAPSGRRPVGGAQFVIVSERARAPRLRLCGVAISRLSL